MRGSRVRRCTCRDGQRKRHRGPCRWGLVLNLGYTIDAATGKRKRDQKWITFRGTATEADAKLTELVRSANRDEFVQPTKLTLGEWLAQWVTKFAVPSLRAPATCALYSSIVRTHLTDSPLARMPLQRVRSTDIEAYYADLLAQHFSPEDLKNLAAFYRTPLGARVLHFSSVTLAEGKDRLKQILRDHQRDFQERFRAEFLRAFPGFRQELERQQRPTR